MPHGVVNDVFSSPLLTFMSQYNVSSRHSHLFSTSPILTSYPPCVYGASAHYLAMCAQSISKRLLVMRRPLPLLATISSNKYSSGLFSKLIRSGPERMIPDRLRNLVKQSLNNMLNQLPYFMFHRRVSLLVSDY